MRRLLNGRCNNDEPPECSEDTERDVSIYNNISGSNIGDVDIKTGHTFLNGDTIGILNLYNVDDDFVKACFIQTVKNKPAQTNFDGCKVFKYVDTPLSQVPKSKSFPVYSRESEYCLEYATFDSPI